MSSHEVVLLEVELKDSADVSHEVVLLEVELKNSADVLT
jgi:hypothetical protein